MDDCKLTTEKLTKLRQPFPADKISFKIQTKPNDKGDALVVAYIDARDVMDRLDDVAGGDWSDEYLKAPSGGLECRLTVLGVTRRDVGEDENKTEPEKSGYSDAFKRAAVKFGIGRFLYNCPKMWAKVEARGNNTYLANGEEVKLQKKLVGYLNGVKKDLAEHEEKHSEGATIPNPMLPNFDEFNGGEKKENPTEWSVTQMTEAEQTKEAKADEFTKGAYFDSDKPKSNGTDPERSKRLVNLANEVGYKLVTNNPTDKDKAANNKKVTGLVHLVNPNKEKFGQLDAKEEAWLTGYLENQRGQTGSDLQFVKDNGKLVLKICLEKNVSWEYALQEFANIKLFKDEVSVEKPEVPDMATALAGA